MKSNELEPNWHLDRHSVPKWSCPETSGAPGASDPNSNEHIGRESIGPIPTSKFVKSFKVAIFYGIVLIPLVCCSFRCTLSLTNEFMWTVSVQAGQSELNGTE